MALSQRALLPGEEKQRDTKRRPRLGFAGIGWIGRHRMQAVVESGLGEVAAVCDTSVEAVEAARQIAPRAEAVAAFEELLQQDLDGVVIATPSAMHAEQAVAALERGLAVFCQKPLARTAAETQRIVEAARRADRLLSVDFSYRHVRGVPEMRELVRRGELGRIYAIDLTFHNAYGPDKPWFYDVRLSGGGCLMDLGIHLADLALWMLDFPAIERIDSKLYHAGDVLRQLDEHVEDFALATWQFQGDVVARMACSWRLSAGRDAVIEAVFYGTQGAVALQNVNGSFYDFQVEQRSGTQRRVLAEPPDSWGGRALLQFAAELAENPGYNERAEELIAVARLIDGSYGR